MPQYEDKIDNVFLTRFDKWGVETSNAQEVAEIRLSVYFGYGANSCHIQFLKHETLGQLSRRLINLGKMIFFRGEKR